MSPDSQATKYLIHMAIDDPPLEALKHQLEMEESSESPITKSLLAVLSYLPLQFPFSGAISVLRDRNETDSSHKIKVMLETLNDVLQTHEQQISALRELPVMEQSQEVLELLLDAARRVSRTRSLERVKRIGAILANGVMLQIDSSKADTIEEMMRIAMELSDRDVSYLADLVRVEGSYVRSHGRLERYDAYTRWEQGSWGTRADGEIDSVFSKLESFGLVSRIPPPNNLNLLADFQNRYVLLRKGLHFVDLASTNFASPVKSPSE
jgi:hypothetical protein